MPTPLAKALVLGLLTCNLSFAQSNGSIASHCQSGEYAYLNAHMSEVHRLNGGYELVKTGKLLSICADRQSEPFGSLAYRFGPIGKVEMERVASPSSKFHIFERSTAPRTGENLLFFTVGPYTYCVTEATGQGSGIGLTVLRAGRVVLDLFSGNDRGNDFESELMEISFSSARSPVFRHLQTANASRTPCDPKPNK